MGVGGATRIRIPFPLAGYGRCHIRTYAHGGALELGIISTIHRTVTEPHYMSADRNVSHGYSTGPACVSGPASLCFEDCNLTMISMYTDNTQK